MRTGVAGNHRRRLAHGVALIVLCGLAAGCSSDITRFQDSILTGSSRPQVQPAPASQPFPGDVDRTYTGSVSSQPQRGGGILGRAGLVARPAESVGGGGMGVASSQPVYQQPQQVQQMPAAPSGTVASGPALAPVARSALDSTVTGSVAPVQQAQPLPTPPAQQAQPRAGGWSADGGSSIMVRQGDTVAALSRRYNVPEDAIRRVNGLSGGQNPAAGTTVVIPTFSQPGQPANVASLPAPSGPQPRPQEPNTLGVLPQQPKVQEGEGQASSQPASTPANGQAPGQGGTYKVVAGDTLSGIARRTGVGVEALKQANGLSSGLIRIGQELRIPAGGQVPATQTAEARPAPANVDPIVTGGAGTASGQSSGQSESSNVAGYTPPTSSSSQTTGSISQQESAPAATGPSGMRWPVRGRVISGFGSSSGGKTNDGIDIAVPEGTAVRAAENGVVIYAGDGLREFGNTVLIRHDDGLVTVYGHNSRINVSRGDTVRRGQEIALSGMSGSADTPRLHFEVRKDSTPVDPMTFLE
jgi:murein DD-endopeptidase MepM/ murein hydrolase activator NlpD